MALSFFLFLFLYITVHLPLCISYSSEIFSFATSATISPDLRWWTPKGELGFTMRDTIQHTLLSKELNFGQFSLNYIMETFIVILSLCNSPRREVKMCLYIAIIFVNPFCHSGAWIWSLCGGMGCTFAIVLCTEYQDSTPAGQAVRCCFGTGEYTAFFVSSTSPVFFLMACLKYKYLLIYATYVFLEAVWFEHRQRFCMLQLLKRKT